MRNSDEVAVKELGSIGLGSYESRAYVSLLRCGKLTPTQVADLAKIPNPRGYDVLRKLEAMRFVVREPKKESRDTVLSSLKPH